MIIKIPYPKRKADWSQYATNAYYAGKHWAKRKQDAHLWHLKTISAVREQVKEPFFIDKPVVISFYWNDKLDIDGHSIMEKMIIDGIVSAGVLQDDTRKYVVGRESYFYDEDFVLIKIRKVDKENDNKKI